MLDDIGFPAISEKRAKEVSEFSPLQRCELIITDSCNLKCSYCKGLSSEYGKTINPLHALNLIDEWAKHNLQHANFSGGEPMCSSFIELYVQRLHARGVPFISLSTNGTFPVKQYENLVKLGATHFAISLDGMNADIADKMAGVSGAWEKAVKSIIALSKISYVTASTVFNKDNYHQAAEIIQFIHSLGVADIRFSTATQYNKLIDQLDKITNEILDVHPILKFRVNNILNGKNTRGSNNCKKCWLPLDDMVVSNKYHFPCSMMARENGQYIGSILNDDGTNKTMKQIRHERALWIESHDCSTNEICQKYCMDFIIAHNNAVNKYKDQNNANI